MYNLQHVWPLKKYVSTALSPKVCDTHARIGQNSAIWVLNCRIWINVAEYSLSSHKHTDAMLFNIEQTWKLNLNQC